MASSAKCERPVPVTDTEISQISTTEQGAVSMLYRNALQRKSHAWACDN